MICKNQLYRYTGDICIFIPKGTPLWPFGCFTKYRIGGENMEKWLYVMMIKKGKIFNKVTKAVITRHVENLKSLVY